MKIAYLDCFSGISGDMFLGALLDAGVPLEELRSALSRLPLQGYSIEAEKTHRNRIFGVRFKVRYDADQHSHRSLAEIKALLERGTFSNSIKNKSIAVFEALATVEAKIHGVEPEEVHFHEVGAVDSIIDIVGGIFCVEYLGIQALYCSPMPLGFGFTESAHGTIPLPAPATAALLKGAPVYGTGLAFELVTPTGAAMAKTLCSSFGPMPPMQIERVGYGLGFRELPDRPNILRVFVGKETVSPNCETVAVLETDIDDASPEWLGFAMERLFGEGALDVAFMPVQMKKNRPGVHLQVVAPPHLVEKMMDIVFYETGTLGIRTSYCVRKVLPRRQVEIIGPFGPIKVKETTGTDGNFLLIPEYEECRRIAKERKIPLKEVYASVIALIKERGR